jgi:hypothetical protein
MREEGEAALASLRSAVVIGAKPDKLQLFPTSSLGQ